VDAGDVVRNELVHGDAVVTDGGLGFGDGGFDYLKA
jgi:hypothetical protein